MPDPFDFSDTSDLPPDMAKRVNRPVKGRRMNGGAIMQTMMRADRPITAAELRAACFRLFGEAPSQKSVSEVLSKYARSGRVLRSAAGYYTLPAVPVALRRAGSN